jgi:hypothetical protein
MPDTDEVRDAHRDTIRRLRGEAMTTLQRAAGEDREPTAAEVVEAEHLLDRALQVQDRLRTLDDTPRPATIPLAASAARPAELVAAGRPTDLVVTEALIERAMHVLAARQEARLPLSAALPSGGNVEQMPGTRDMSSVSDWPNRLFAHLDYRMTAPTSFTDKVYTLAGQVAADVVAEGAAKRAVGTLAMTGLTRVKRAGHVTFTWEQTLIGDDLRTIVLDALVPALIQAENDAVVDAITPTTTSIAFTDSAASSLLLAIATVAVWGGATAIILNPADIVTVVGQIDTQGAYMVSTDPTEQTPTLWGLPLFFVPTVPAGTGFVIDRRAVEVHLGAPPELILGWSNLSTNTGMAVVDEQAGVAMKRVTGVAKVDLDGVAAAAATTRKR